MSANQTKTDQLFDMITWQTENLTMSARVKLLRRFKQHDQVLEAIINHDRFKNICNCHETGEIDDETGFKVMDCRVCGEGLIEE